MWSCGAIIVFVPFLLAEEITPLPKSLIQDQQTSDCQKAYQSSYQERLGLDRPSWAKKCGMGKTPDEILQLALKIVNGRSQNIKAGEKGKNLAQNSLRSLDQTKSFGAYYDGGGPVTLAFSGPVSASGLKAGRLSMVLLASGASAQKQQARLLANFEKHLDIKGTPQEKQMIFRTLSDISGSLTARSLMQDFIKFQGHHAVSIRFVDMSDSHLTITNGLNIVKGTSGTTDIPTVRDPGITVRLSKLYLEADPHWSRADLPDTLSHELLGHALEEIKAEKMRVAMHAYGQTTLNEMEALLVGWTVSAELPLPMTDAHARQYARDYQNGDLHAYFGLNPATISD